MLHTRLTTAVAAAALAAAVAAPAAATVVEKGRFTDETYAYGYDCGFPVEVTGVASGNFRLREGKNDDATLFFSLDRVAFQEIHTNPETGAWFSFRGRFLEAEPTGRRVDGSVFEVRGIKAGPLAIVEDSSGALVTRERGVVRSTILFDTGGDDVPGGTFIEEVSLEFGGPHASFGDLCSIAEPLIG